MSTVLITGASSGIGMAMAREFARHGHDLFLVARREEVLKRLCEELEREYRVNAGYLACDLAEDPGNVLKYCHKEGIMIDVLINNAGYGDYRPFIDGDLDKLLEMIDLNDRALTALTYDFVNDMKERGGGQIINVGSVASFFPGPWMAVYYATKAYVMSFSLALREELKDFGVSVSVLCPGPVKSQFWKRADKENSAMEGSAFARSPADAAKTAYRLYETKKAYVVDGALNKVTVFLSGLLPLKRKAGAVGMIQKKMKG